MASYHHVHSPTELQETMERVGKALTAIPARRSFSSILCTGQSGIIPASIVAYETFKDLCILRKDGENSHGDSWEGQLSDDYIIIDDFPSSGATLHRLIECAKARGRGLPRYIIFYREASSEGTFRQQYVVEKYNNHPYLYTVREIKHG